MAEFNADHRCGDADCPYFGQRTFSQCGCHKSRETMLREEVARLAAIVEAHPLSEAKPMTRFYIDHSVIHDSVTGKHVKTDGEPPFEDSVEQVCALLNTLDYGLSNADQKAQGKRCGCHGHDDYCVCQNVPDAVTWAERRKSAHLTSQVSQTARSIPGEM
jgi:hypothetical protein